MSLHVLQSLRNLSPTCRDAARLISEATEHDLGPTERAGLVMHLAICRACRSFRRSVGFLRALLAAAAQSHVLSSADSLPSAARERIGRKLRIELDRSDRHGP